MTKNETLQVLAIIKVAYPNSFNKLTKQDIETLANLWELQFKEYDYQLVMGAVNTIISSDLNDFMPTIARIKDVCCKLTNPNQISEVEAWQCVNKALNNSAYNAYEEYNKLPAICQKIVGSPNKLWDWSMMNANEVETIIYSNFLKSFRILQEREREDNLIPLSVRKSIMLESK